MLFDNRTHTTKSTLCFNFRNQGVKDVVLFIVLYDPNFSENTNKVDNNNVYSKIQNRVTAYVKANPRWHLPKPKQTKKPI